MSTFDNSFDLIVPFLRPLEHLLMDPEISEIMINGSRHVFIERNGALARVEGVALDNNSLVAAAKHIARSCRNEVNDETPLGDARLPDGSRVAIILPPCARSGVTITVRKFGARRYSLAELVSVGALSAPMHERLLTALATHQNVLISGGTAAGKTTVLNACVSALPHDDRVIVIEETAEIFIDEDVHPNVVRLEARRAQDSLPEIAIRDLLRAALRHRPDHLIVGEVRGREAVDLLGALNTGHDGSLSTVHANSARLALQRLISYALQAGELPHDAICAQIADTIHLVLHLDRRQGRRCARELVRVCGYDFHTRAWQLETLCSNVWEATQPCLPSPRQALTA